MRQFVMMAAYDPALYATDRRTLVFVDAGFLLTVMQAHHQVSERSMLVIDHPRLVELLRGRAESLLGCPVLRIYWYDAAHPSRRIPNLVAAEMGRVDGVRVRLGTLNIRPDGRYEQKAVDTLLVRDMIAHAYKKTAQEMVLLSGDNDLAPGVEEAQEQGVRVHLWSIRGDDLPPSVGRHLADLADTRLDLEAGDLATAIATTTASRVHASVAPVERSPEPPETTAVPSPSGVESQPQVSVSEEEVAAVGEVSAASTPSGPLASTGHADVTVPEPDAVVGVAGGSTLEAPPVVSPRDLAASIRAQSPAVFARSREDEFPRLYDLDRDAYNAPFSGHEGVDLGAEYARRWAAAVGADTLFSVLGLHDPGFDGNIPRQADSDLLYFGSDHGLDTYAQPKKFALRQGFWEGVQQVSAAP